jgi:hypothetical protein
MTNTQRAGSLRVNCLAGSLLFAVALPAVARAQSLAPPPAVAPRDFAIMAWGRSPSDAGQLKEMKQAGLNISGFCRAADVDRVFAAGLACFVTDGRVNGYDWKKLPADETLRANLASLRAQVGDDPAVLGALLLDEPSVALMPGLGHVADAFRQAMPGRWPYVNLFPTHASAAQLGVADYEAYVRREIDLIHPPFLSFDNYSLVNGEMLERFYANLEIIRRLSLEAKIPFWNCILAVAHFNYMEPSDATFNLQVYSTLAYGGRGIEYFTYFTPEVGNYRLAAIDQFGNKTATWDMLRRINLQIRALAPTLRHLHSTGVFHAPDVPPEGHPLSESRLVNRLEMRTPSIRPPIPPHYLVGEFEDDRGRSYLMLVNKDLTHSFLFRLELKQTGRKLFRVSPYTGREEPLAGEMDWLAPGAGILLRIE